MKIHGSIRVGREVLGEGDGERLCKLINEKDADRLAKRGVIEIEDGDEFTGNPEGTGGRERRVARTDEPKGPAFGAKGVGEVAPPSSDADVEAQLATQDKDALVKYAEDEGIEVTRADGKDGTPLKDDYVRAIAKYERSRAQE